MYFFCFRNLLVDPNRILKFLKNITNPIPTLVAAVALHSKTQPTWFHRPSASLKVHRYHKHHPYSIDGAQISWRPPKDMGIFLWGCIVSSNDLSGIKGDDRSGMDLSMVACFF